MSIANFEGVMIITRARDIYRTLTQQQDKVRLSQDTRLIPLTKPYIPDPDNMIHFVDSTSSDVLHKLYKRLKAHLPESLPVLGAIVQNSLDHDSEPPVAPPRLYVWTSFDPGTPPRCNEIFSVITLAMNDNSARFFCSADLQKHVNTSEEEYKHVSLFIRDFLRYLSKDEGHDIPISADPATGEPTRGVLLGSLHDKWLKCISDLVGRVSPCIKFIRRPQEESYNTTDLLSDFIVSQILPSDIATVMSASHIRRSPAYILGRSSRSICIRLPPTSADDKGEPIAWALLHADGSVGTLHVQNEYRRRGLAGAVTKELIRKVGGGAEGWNWADVIIGNAESEGFYGSLDGWERGWTCHWVFLKFPDIAL